MMPHCPVAGGSSNDDCEVTVGSLDSAERGVEPPHVTCTRHPERSACEERSEGDESHHRSPRSPEWGEGQHTDTQDDVTATRNGPPPHPHPPDSSCDQRLIQPSLPLDSSRDQRLIQPSLPLDSSRDLHQKQTSHPLGSSRDQRLIQPSLPLDSSRDLHQTQTSHPLGSSHDQRQTAHPPDSSHDLHQTSHPPDSSHDLHQTSHPPDSSHDQRQFQPPHLLDSSHDRPLHHLDSSHDQRLFQPSHPLDSSHDQAKPSSSAGSSHQIRPLHPPDSSHDQSRISSPHPSGSPGTQASGPQEPSCHHSFSSGVSPCSTQDTGVISQPGVSQQIVLNFGERGDVLTLDGAPPESVSQCHRGCHSSQRVAKQIVLVFVNQPLTSSEPTRSVSCGGPVNASTQTGSVTCHAFPPLGSQTRSFGTQTDRSPEWSDPSPIQVTPRSSHSTQTERSLSLTFTGAPRVLASSGGPINTVTRKCETPGTRGRSPLPDVSRGLPESPQRDFQPSSEEPMDTTSPEDHIPCRGSSQQTDQSEESLGVPRVSLQDSGEGNAQITDDAALKSLHSCSSPSSHNRKSCATSCLPPSLNLFLDNLLEQHRLSLDDLPPSSAPGPASQPHVQQIILNFLESAVRPISTESQNIPCPDPSPHISKSEEQDKPSMTSMPKDRDVTEPSNSKDVTKNCPAPLWSTAASQDVPEGTGTSPSPLIHRAASQDVLGLREATHNAENPHIDVITGMSLSPALMRSKPVHQHVPDHRDLPQSAELSRKPEGPHYPSADIADDYLQASRPVTQDVPSPGTHPDLFISDTSPILRSKPENQYVTDDGPINDSIPSRPVTRDVPSPRTNFDLSTSNTSLITSKPEDQGVPNSDFASHPTPSKPMIHDLPSPGTHPDLSSSNTSPILTSKPENQGVPNAGPTSDSTPSRPVTWDIPVTDASSDSTPSKPMIQNVPSPGTHPDSSISDTYPIFTSKPENQDVTIVDPTSDSMPIRREFRDVPSPGTHPDLSTSNTSPILTSKPDNQGFPNADSTSHPTPSKPMIHDLNSPVTHPDLPTSDISPVLTSKPENQGVPNAGLTTESTPSRPVTWDIPITDSTSDSTPSKPMIQDVPSPGTHPHLSTSNTSPILTSKLENWDVPNAGPTSVSTASRPVTQDVPSPGTHPDLSTSPVLTSKPENRGVPNADSTSQPTPSKPMIQDVPSPGTHPDLSISDTSPILTSKPENQAFTDAGFTSDSIHSRPEMQDFPISGTYSNLSASNTSVPVLTSKPLNRDISNAGPSRDPTPSKPVTQDVPTPGTHPDFPTSGISPVLTSKPKNQSISNAGPTRDPTPSRPVTWDISITNPSSDSTHSKPVTQDVPNPRTHPDLSASNTSLKITSKPENWDVPNAGPTSDSTTSRPVTGDIPITDPSSNSAISRPVTQDVPSPGTHNDLSASGFTSRPENQRTFVADPTRDSTTSRPENPDIYSPGAHSDVSASGFTSRPENQDILVYDPTRDSTRSRPVTQDVPSPGTHPNLSASDISSVLTSSPVTWDIPIADPSSDSKPSKPMTQDIPSAGTHPDLSASDISPILTSKPENQDVPIAYPSSDSTPSKPVTQDVPSPGNHDDLSTSDISLVLSRPVTGDIPIADHTRDSTRSRPVIQDVPSPGTHPNLSTSGISPVLTIKPENQDIPIADPSSDFTTSRPVTGDIPITDPSSDSTPSKPVTQDVPSAGTHPNLSTSDISPVLTSKPVIQDIPITDPSSDSIPSKPVTGDMPITDPSSDSMTSRPVTGDIPITDPSSDSVTSRPVTGDIPITDPSSDSMTSRPVTGDIPITDPSSDSMTSRPVTGDMPIAAQPAVSKVAPRPGSSSPVITSRILRECQTGDETSEESEERPESPPCEPQRPPKSQSCPALTSEAMTSSVTQGAELRVPMAVCEEGSPRSHIGGMDEVTFDDIAVYFTKEEWEVLEGPQKGLYCQVMMDNYQSLSSLGFLLDKPGLISRIEDEEAELWEDPSALGRLILRDPRSLPTLLTTDVPSQEEEKEASGKAARESAGSCSHLGALMRLVNEIPGYLLGGSSPGPNLEDMENIRPCSEVKTEESSPSCTPASVQPIEETSESSSPGPSWGAEKSHTPATNKSEEVEIPIHPPVHIKSELSTGTAASPPRDLPIKQEEVPVLCSRAGGVLGKPKIRSLGVYKPPASWECHPADSGRQAGSGGGETPWTSLPPSFPRNTSASPASLSDGTNSTTPKDLHIKIKQEDSGSELDPAESPVPCKKVPGFPMAPSPGVLEHLRLGASPRRSTMDRRSPHPQELPHGKSHLHGLVNCLKEISASRSWAHLSTPSSSRCGGETDRSPAVKRAAPDSSSPSRVLSVLWRPPDDILKDESYLMTGGSPNPFTVAVTNGSARLKGADAKMAEAYRSRMAEPPAGGALIPEKCLERGHMRPSMGQNSGSRGLPKSEDVRRAELGVKRTHSDDPPHLPVKRPALDSSPSRVMGTLWVPPDDGKCPLMSVRNCVRKIPTCWGPPPPVRGSAPGATVHDTCPTRTGTQGGGTSGKMVEVKEERSPSPNPTPTRQWLPPARTPNSPDQSGASSTNVHLSGLMRLMEEIPVAESSSSSRAMYNIAIGHAMMRRSDRSNFLSYYPDEGSFQAELNDNTVASMDSVYSDDTSLSSENLDPSYSAIGGLQRVVSEFAELGSVSPLVAVAVPPSTSSSVREPPPASTPRMNDAVRGSQRGTPMSSASVCSAEDGEAAYAALCGLQKVVHGFSEQECVSPFSAVRGAPQHSGPREGLTKRSYAAGEEEAESPRPPDSSPALATRFLCEGSWPPNADSSYSALSGLQKVVNGFSDLGCVSPFSAVSTSASESAIEICSRKPPALDTSCSALSGLKKVVNGVADMSCVSPATASSNPSSVGEPDPNVRRRCEHSEAHGDPARSHGPSVTSQKNPPRSSSQCIDLTQEEEPASAKSRVNLEKPSPRKDLSRGRTPESSVKPMGRRSRPPAIGQLIDLTEEEEPPVRHALPSAEPARKPQPVSVLSAGQHRTTSDRKHHRAPITGARAQRMSVDRPLDPGPSGPHRAGIPAINEHISGLEKLLKGVPTFTPPNAPSGPRRSGSWWFKSTSPHET